ncbi:MAG TPA: folylpolyglutamate synthase/dihydrofolate synthase family protein [Methylomirabilota bacterium]|nr:folylpolyglutamate synthase/dihydrofolate synthase family protein [Methylomirabilota bacterium]
MNYPEAIQYLQSLQVFGARPGLDAIRALASRAGNPQENLRFIHVAGTNGKGSVCAMIESMLRAAGWKTGLFTSPHLVAFGERIQVNRIPLSEPGIVRSIEFLRPLAEQLPEGLHPTLFELATVMALREFAEQECDVVIWETGLGGRLDATNIVLPLVSVITNVQFDHEQWLGNTHAQIAAEKAGIIKPGVPVITAADEPEALEVIRSACERHRSTCTRVTGDDAARPPLDTVKLPLLGEHQKLNAAVALETVRAIAGRFPVDDPACRRGLESVHWPGRLQLITRPSGGRVLLDAAHNPAGMERLRTALEQHFPGERPVVILGALEDKNWDAMCRLIAPLGSGVHLVPVASMRTASPTAMAGVCREAGSGMGIHAHASLDDALRMTAAEPFVLITGSLYLVGEALEHLGQSPALGADERSLNEWSTTR